MIEQIALGKLGMSVNEYCDITPRQFDNKLRGFNAHYNNAQDQAWVRMRIAAFIAIAPHAKKGAINKPEDLFTLPGEQEQIQGEKRPPMSTEEALELAEKWK